MTNANQFILDNIAVLVTAGLLLIVVLLVVIALILWKGRTTHLRAQLSIGLGDQITELQRAAEHHADVSAVVSMVRQLDEMDEDAVALLGSYPESVRAAAWLHYINRLGSDLQAAQQRLSDAHQHEGAYAHFYGDITTARQSCQQHVDDVRAKLDKAIELSGHIRLQAV